MTSKRSNKHRTNHYEMDAGGAGAIAALALVVTTIVGVGFWRRRSDTIQATCKPLEDSVYRGFKYRIDQCPLGSSHGFLAIIPVQSVGPVSIATDEGSLLATIDDARKYVQAKIDAKLTTAVPPIIVGSVA